MGAKRNPMRLGYNTNGFTCHRLRDALEVIAGLGFRAVALTLDHGALDPYDDATPERAESIAAWLAEHDLLPIVETGARFILDPWRLHWPTLLSPNPTQRHRRIDFLKRSIDLAVRLGAPVVSFCTGTAETDEPLDALDDRLVGGLRVLARYAAERDVVLALEPEPTMYVHDMVGYRRIQEKVGEPWVRLTLDVGHAHLTEDSAVETVRRFFREIVNVHLEGMHRFRHEHLLPGEGDLDLPAVIAVLREGGYKGSANLELSRHAHMAVEAARRAVEFFRPLGLP